MEDPPEVEGQEEVLQPESVLRHEDKVLRNDSNFSKSSSEFKHKAMDTENVPEIADDRLMDFLYKVNALSKFPSIREIFNAPLDLHNFLKSFSTSTNDLNEKFSELTKQQMVENTVHFSDICKAESKTVPKQISQAEAEQEIKELETEFQEEEEREQCKELLDIAKFKANNITKVESDKDDSEDEDEDEDDPLNWHGELTGQQKYYAKLARRYYRPFQILRPINEMAYQLKLPSHCPIHNAFHVSLLKAYKGDPPQESVLDDPPKFKGLEEILQPEQIIGMKTRCYTMVLGMALPSGIRAWLIDLEPEMGGNDMEVMIEEANGLPALEDIYNVVYEDALDLDSYQEEEQELASCEECVQPVAEKSEIASIEEVMSFCDDESVSEEGDQVESLFDGVSDDIKFLDSLLFEADDDVFFSFPFDIGMLEDVTYDFFDRLLDEEMPFEKIIGASKKDGTCADASNVGFACPFAGMYAFQCLLKVAFVACNAIIGVSKVLECGVAYVGPNKDFCEGNHKEGSFMVHMHVYGRVIDAFFGTRLICGTSMDFSWKSCGGLVKLLAAS
ncbi:hypothetical protein L7F22_005610 [Adiantum nelumboides]|nr:hypothetical protein [Adiantum nelumboides]